MVQEYTEQFYVPAIKRRRKLPADNLAGAKALGNWKDHMRTHWPKLRVLEVQAPSDSDYPVGAEIPVRATLFLGTI